MADKPSVLDRLYREEFVLAGLAIVILICTGLNLGEISNADDSVNKNFASIFAYVMLGLSVLIIGWLVLVIFMEGGASGKKKTYGNWSSARSGFISAFATLAIIGGVYTALFSNSVMNQRNDADQGTKTTKALTTLNWVTVGIVGFFVVVLIFNYIRSEAFIQRGQKDQLDKYIKAIKLNVRNGQSIKQASKELKDIFKLSSISEDTQKELERKAISIYTQKVNAIDGTTTGDVARKIAKELIAEGSSIGSPLLVLYGNKINDLAPKGTATLDDEARKAIKGFV